VTVRTGPVDGVHTFDDSSVSCEWHRRSQRRFRTRRDAV